MGKWAGMMGWECQGGERGSDLVSWVGEESEEAEEVPKIARVYAHEGDPGGVLKAPGFREELGVTRFEAQDPTYQEYGTTLANVKVSSQNTWRSVKIIGMTRSGSEIRVLRTWTAQ